MTEKIDKLYADYPELEEYITDNDIKIIKEQPFENTNNKNSLDADREEAII